METVGLVGVGKIGLPISENLIKSGYRVVGYRRSSLAEFEKVGGIAGRSAADVGAWCRVPMGSSNRRAADRSSSSLGPTPSPTKSVTSLRLRPRVRSSSMAR